MKVWGTVERDGMMNEQTQKRNAEYHAERTVKPAMVQASISSPRSALYFAAEATPYNLEHLRAHVRALHDSAGEPTCLSLNLGAGSDDVVVAEIQTLADELRRKGIEVRFCVAVDQSQTRSATNRIVQAGSR